MTTSTAAQPPVIAIDQLLTMALSALDNYFFKSHKDRARKLYKQIAAGDVVEIASLTFKSGHEGQVKMKLALDHSEYRGHLTFHMFKLALQQTLNNIAGKLNRKQNLNLFTSEESPEVLVHLPGLIQDREHINVLVLGLLPARNSATIRLQFLDPDQFRKEDVADEGAAASGE